MSEPTAQPDPRVRVKVECGAWMPKARDHCARNLGHGGNHGDAGHRSRWALDNNRDAKWYGVR